jgi:hypothetical protein
MVPIAPEAHLTLFDAIAAVIVIYYWRVGAQAYKLIGGLMLISVIAMAASGYMYGTPLQPFLGRAYPMMAAAMEVCAYFVLILLGDDRRRAALVAGSMLGICAHYFYPSDPRILEEPIKFLIGIPLGTALIALTVLAARGANLPLATTMAIMILYAIFCFLVGSRSIGGAYFVSAVALAFVTFISVPKNYSRIAPFAMLLVCLATYGVTELYTMLALNGYFGDRAAGIAAFQTMHGSILLGGRPEIIVNLSGIRDAPFFGVGIRDYPSIYLYELINLSVYSEENVLGFDNILYHSAIFGTAFESGIFSAIFWTFGLYITLFSVPLLRTAYYQTRYYVLPLQVITVWHLIYSPPVPYNRFVLAIGLGFSLWLYMSWRSRSHDSDANRAAARA